METTELRPITMAPSDWRGSAGERWAANVDHYETMLAGIARALLEKARFTPGERVVEIGCGGGGFTREVAAAVSPEGEVVGLDISPVLVELATARATNVGVRNCRFVAGDAQVDSAAGAPFDRLTSRFGVMFFPDPARAMRNLHGMLKRGARLDVAVWVPVEENPMFSVMMGAARRHVALPPAVPQAPGPLAFSDVDYFRELLEGGGFGEIRFDTWRGELRPAGSSADAKEAAKRIMTTNAMIDALTEAGEDVCAGVLLDLERALIPYQTPSGVVLPTAVHLVSAIA